MQDEMDVSDNTAFICALNIVHNMEQQTLRKVSIHVHYSMPLTYLQTETEHLIQAPRLLPRTFCARQCLWGQAYSLDNQYLLDLPTISIFLETCHDRGCHGTQDAVRGLAPILEALWEIFEDESRSYSSI